MAISKVFSIRNFAIKQLMKTGDDGIMKMPSNMKADFAEAMLTKQLIDAGIDPRTIKNEQQMINVLDGIDDMKKKMAEMAIKDQTGITSAKVFDLKGKRIKDTDNIMGGEEMPPPGSRGGKDDIAAPVQSSEETIKNMIEAENKKNIAKIKNRKMIDEAIDNVSTGFVRGDNKYNAELVAEEIALRRGLNVDDLSTRERADIYGEAYESLMKKMRDDSDFADGGRIGLKGGADAATESFTKSAGSSAKARKGSVSVSPSGNVTFNPDNAKNRNNPLRDIIDSGSNFNYLRNLYKMDPVGIGASFLMNRLGNLLFPPAGAAEVNMEELSTKGGLLNDPFMEKQVIERITQAENDYMRKTGNLPPEFMGDRIRMNMYKGAMQGFKGPGFAEGGRIGLKDGMDRRTFLKIIGGLASIPVLGKFFKGAKVASKAAPVAEKMVGTSTEAPTYFLKLVDKITKQGKPTTSTEDIMETYIYTAKNGDSYELVNDLKTGDLRITKDKTGVGTYGDKSFDTIEDRTVMEYKAQRQDVDVETGKSTRDGPEYEEYKVEFDADGTEAGAEAIEETVQKEIIEESAEEAPSIKKADGGRVGLLSGGGILRVILTNLAKDKGMKPSEYLRLTNYKSLPDSTKRMISKDEFLKLKSDMTEKRVELMDTVKEMIVSRQGFEKSKDDLRKSMNMASEGYGDKAVEMMFPPGSFKSPVPAGSGQKDVMMMEQLIKNLKTKDRQLNASGGVAYMLGE